VEVDPWVVVLTLLATSGAWFLPSQTSYLVAQSVSEGRLFSYAQAGVSPLRTPASRLGGLALSIHYWRFLGLLKDH
jgi:hypothetical protein